MKSESVPEVDTCSDGRNGPGDRDVVLERRRLIDQHIGPAAGEALIVRHVIAGHAGPIAGQNGTGLAGSLTYSS